MQFTAMVDQLVAERYKLVKTLSLVTGLLTWSDEKLYGERKHDSLPVTVAPSATCTTGYRRSGRFVVRAPLVISGPLLKRLDGT